MNHTEDPLESVLRRAPRPEPPRTLRERLLQGIPPRRADGSPVGTRGLTPPAWWRRWWPAVAGGSLACACLAMVGIQQAEIRTLHAEVQRLKVELAAPAKPTPHGTAQGSRSAVTPAVAEVPINDGPAELTRLRATVAELTAEAAQLEALRTENAQLRAQIASRAGLTTEETEALSEAKAKAQRIACVNNLKQLGLAVRIWETDHGDVFPPDVLSMTNEMGSPKILVCPADEGRQAAADWTSFSTANLSYQYLAASADSFEPQRVMWVCPIHHNVTLCDGSVQQLSAERFAGLIQRDGKLYLETPAATPPTSPTGMTPEMMQRYGLVPPGTVPAGMNPEMAKRYGLQPGVEGAGVAGAEAPATNLQMDPRLMMRYGLLPKGLKVAEQDESGAATNPNPPEEPETP